LASSPWVTDSCRYFFPGIGELIKQLNIQIVYAREGLQIEDNKMDMMSKEQFETFWAETKGKAISKAVSEFYSQYKGQSWKNIISLGDSHFERYGTMAATMQYAESQGLVNDEAEEEEEEEEDEAWRQAAEGGSVGSRASRLSVSSVKRREDAGLRRRMSWEGTVNGHEIKVRTKTLKMLEEPTVEELIVELSLLHRWLPLMVGLDDGFDVDVNSLDGEADINKIESRLRAPRC
jgi:CRISPR/Cas system-associated protein Cas5 (RAMP superfamily)